jgi:hypothetical protein
LKILKEIKNKLKFIILKNIIYYYITILKHKIWVLIYLIKFSINLIYRGIFHDTSKFKFDESYYFIKIIHKLKHVKYGSEEYHKNLKNIYPAIEKHYQRNSHHPQYYKNGIYDMNIIDLIEMCCDWKASVKNHKIKNINNSFNISFNRFNLNDSIEGLLLKKIINNIKTII